MLMLSLLCLRSPERGCVDRELCPKHGQAPKCQKAPCDSCLYPSFSWWLLVLIFQPSIKEGVEPFHFHGCFSLCHSPAPCFCSILTSDSGGWLDFGGEDLPEPSLQLLHVWRFGSGQVKASSPLLSVPSSQRSTHLEDREHSDSTELNCHEPTENHLNLQHLLLCPVIFL